MPPERDWRAPPDEAGDDALQYSDIAIGYLSRNARYRADYIRALNRVKRGATSADEATSALVNRWGVSFHAAPASAFALSSAAFSSAVCASAAPAVEVPSPSGAEGEQAVSERASRVVSTRRMGESWLRAAL